MATLRCQHCDQPLTAAEIQDGWCEGCGKKVPPGLVSVAARGNAEVAPHRETASVQRAPVSEVAVARSNAVLGWGTVRAGLAQVFVGVFLLALGLALYYMEQMGDKSAPGKVPGTGKLVFELVTQMLIIIGGLLCAAGMCMGCAAPSDPGPRGWAVGVAACVGLLLAVFLLQNTFVFENRRVILEDLENTQRSFRSFQPGVAPKRQEPPYGEGTMKAVRYTLEGLVWLGGALFLLFLRATASTLRRSALALSAVLCAVVFVVVGVSSAYIRIAAADGSISSATLVTLGWARVGVAAVMGVWILVLVALTRGTVTRALAS